MRFATLFAMCALGVCIPAYAGYFSYSGYFVTDDSHVNVSFTVYAATTVSIQTWSYGGGIDPLSNSVVSGGFAPVLSLFDSSQTLLAYDTGGSAPACGTRSIDGVTGLCLDAMLSLSINAGNYLLVLTENDNTPLGSTYSDGFLRDFTGDFTGPEFLGVAGSFIDPGLNQRNGSYDLSLSLVDTSSLGFYVPEPSTSILVVAGLALCALGARLRQRPARNTLVV